MSEKEIKTTQIALHRRIDSDEVASVWLIRSFPKKSEQRWPGSSTAKLVPFTMDMLPVDKTEKDFPGTLFIGCGKGKIDEHSTRRMDQCALSRTAHHMGIRQLPEIAPIIRMTLMEDRNPQDVAASFAASLKTVSAMWPDEPELTIKWASKFYTAVHEAPQGSLPLDRALNLEEAREAVRVRWGNEELVAWDKVVTDAKALRLTLKNQARQILKKAPVEKLWLDGREILLQVVEGSDNNQLNYVAWRENHIGVFIQQTTSGNVQIYTKQTLHLDLRRVAMFLRQRELQERGLPAIKSPQQLMAVDTLEEVRQWHLFNTDTDNKPILFNGSETAYSVEPTVLKLKNIVSLVRGGLGLSSIAPARSSQHTPKKIQSVHQQWPANSTSKVAA